MLGFSLSWDGTGLTHAITTFVEFIRATTLFCPENTASLQLSTLQWLLVFLPPLLQWCLSLRRVYKIDVSFRAQHSAETNCESLSITIYCKQKLLSWGLREVYGPLMKGVSKSLGATLMLTFMGIANETCTSTYSKLVSTNERTFSVLSFWVWATSLGTTVSSFDHLPVDFTT